MENVKTRPMTFRTSEEIREDFKCTYEESGATSQNEFLGMLLKKWLEPKEINKITSADEPIEIPSILTPEETQSILKSSFEASEATSIDEFLDILIQKFNKVEIVHETKSEPTLKELKENQILISLTPAQNFAIRETVLSDSNFAEIQNKIIDSWNYKKRENYYSGLISEPEFETLWVRNKPMNEKMLPEQKEAIIRHNMSAILVNMFLTKLIKGKIKTTNFKPRALRSFINENSPGCNVSDVGTDIELNDNEILLNLTPAQMFAIRETTLVDPNFAEIQNEIIDSLVPENKPFLYFGNLFEPEFQLLWVKNIPLTDDMTPEQREPAIRNNMAAFLLNMFLINFVEEKIDDSKATASSLKSFIQELEVLPVQMEDSKPKSVEAPKPEKVTS